jgi:indolepyruvate decarboxylase
MTTIKIANHLFNRIKDAGVECTFGIPGDFVLPLYAAQASFGLRTVVMTHEPSVGYAADAYARVKGLGVALVTYGAGGLNMVNATALAYAEESPLLVVSGSPETKLRTQKPLLHHCVKRFDTQLKVYEEVTESQALIDNKKTAQQSIDNVINATMAKSRPGYIELPRDMVNTEIEVTKQSSSRTAKTDPVTMRTAIKEIVARLNSAKRAVLFAGAQIRRFNTLDQIIQLVEAINIPVVTSALGKSSFPESHKNFIGTYFGKFGDAQVRDYVESADCILCIGAVLTEMETGGFTAELPLEKLITINANNIGMGDQSSTELDFRQFIDKLTSGIISGATVCHRFRIPSIEAKALTINSKSKMLTVAFIINALNQMLDNRYSVTSDVGDCLYAGLGLRTDNFFAPGNYSSMGFGVPAGIGAQLANPKMRSVVLVGDGGFQMTGAEIATAVRLGINPIIVLFNNSSYGMLRFLDQERDYYHLSGWDYCRFAESLGAESIRATTKQAFSAALKGAVKLKRPVLIEAVIAEDDISPALRRMTDHFGQKIRTIM